MPASSKVSARADLANKSRGSCPGEVTWPRASVPFAPTWTQSASAVGQAAGLFAKGGVDGRLVCLRRHLRLDPRHGPRTHAERPGDLVLSHAALGDGLAYGLFRLLIGPRPAQSLITLFRA